MREVEAELVRTDVRAGLPDVGAEPLPQRGVQQMGRGVVALGRVPGGAVDVRVDALAHLDRAPLRDDREHLVVAEPQHVVDPGAAVAVQALDVARVGDLAAAGGVERATRRA